MNDPLQHYREVWLLDFEFHAPPGERPTPLCLAALEFKTGRTIKRWADDLTGPPFATSEDTLFVAYYASAELGCFLALGWELPKRTLDLFTEFRCLTNGLHTTSGNGLLGALAHFGLSSIDVAEKTEMRDLAIRGGPYTEGERAALCDYCMSDVEGLAKLLPAMLPKIDLPRALLRGRYMGAAAAMEWNGVPIDTETLGELRSNWGTIKGRLIRSIDAGYGVYVPTGKVINPASRFGAALFNLADETGVNPYQLAEVADDLWRTEKDAKGDLAAAYQAARRATGLTLRAIEKWEDAGRDYSSWPKLDDLARTLAGEYPELGIGQGYNQEGGADDTDHAALLWERLRQPDPRPTPKHDPALLGQAAEWATGAEYEGPLSFSSERFAGWLTKRRIPWPRTETGQLSLSDDTFRQMSRAYPEVSALRELRHSLSEMRLESLAVGGDGRNRCLLSPFRSITGRNQPSNAKFIFGPSCWLRGLICPVEGRAVAYVDWSQQEFGIAAALSGDRAMQEAYASGDPYLSFAKQAGLAPPEATKDSHPAERERCKVCILAVQYGMGEHALGQSLGMPVAYARELLRLHRETYPRFWKWSQAAVDHAMLKGYLYTVFGWRVQVGPKANPRSLANFPMQANGAEMLRLACCLATERGIQVCAPVHDAILVEGDDDEMSQVVTETQAAMVEASRAVLSGFALRSDAKVIRYPERYSDPRGVVMWDTVTGILDDLEAVTGAAWEDDF